jgi:hypothetical protein
MEVKQQLFFFCCELNELYFLVIDFLDFSLYLFNELNDVNLN